MIHCLLSLWECSDVPEHSQSEQFNLMLKFFVRYFSFKIPQFSFVLSFLNHNSRTRIFVKILFLEKVKKKHWQFCTEVKKYIQMDQIFARTLKTLLCDFLSPPSQAHLNFFLKNWDPSLFLFYDVKIHGGK